MTDDGVNFVLKPKIDSVCNQKKIAVHFWNKFSFIS